MTNIEIVYSKEQASYTIVLNEDGDRQILSIDKYTDDAIKTAVGFKDALRRGITLVGLSKL